MNENQYFSLKAMGWGLLNAMVYFHTGSAFSAFLALVCFVFVVLLDIKS